MNDLKQHIDEIDQTLLEARRFEHRKKTRSVFWWALGCAVMIFLVAYSSSAETNLLDDPSFEDTSTYWYTSTYGQAVDTVPRTGSYDFDLWSGRVKLFGYWFYYNGYISQTKYSLEPGTYTFGVWTKADGASTIELQGCEYNYPEGDSLVDLNPCDEYGTYTTIASRETFEADSDWVYLSGEFTSTGADETYLRIYDSAYNNITKWHIDDAVLTKNVTGGFIIPFVQTIFASSSCTFFTDGATTTSECSDASIQNPTQDLFYGIVLLLSIPFFVLILRRKGVKQ